MSCADEERDIHHCTHHCCHTCSPLTHMHTATTKAHPSGRLQESHLFTLHANSLNNSALLGHRDYLRGNSHRCTHTRVRETRVAPVLITGMPVHGSEYTWTSTKPPRYVLMETMCCGCMLEGFSRLFKDHRNHTAALPHISDFMQSNAHVTSCSYLSVFVERFAGSRLTGSLLGWGRQSTQISCLGGNLCLKSSWKTNLQQNMSPLSLCMQQIVAHGVINSSVLE